MDVYCVGVVFFFQAEDGIRDLVRSRGLGDVYKRQRQVCTFRDETEVRARSVAEVWQAMEKNIRDSELRIREGELKIERDKKMADLMAQSLGCLLYTSDAADDLLCVDLGGRRII
eukprot:TRINITY_DN18136_c0_g1_i4.p1 TRINITY_DN18136_c0_g1~~TRINITY_DN18136_c0_g1_i4.p1  ORF type:complete len:115 (+),score=63.14 TRINITY_DN18136_c0_g1_i4:63-407(+)